MYCERLTALALALASVFTAVNASGSEHTKDPTATTNVPADIPSQDADLNTEDLPLLPPKNAQLNKDDEKTKDKSTGETDNKGTFGFTAFKPGEALRNFGEKVKMQVEEKSTKSRKAVESAKQKFQSRMKDTRFKLALFCFAAVVVLAVAAIGWYFLSSPMVSTSQSVI